LDLVLDLDLVLVLDLDLLLDPGLDRRASVPHLDEPAP
jgi:hypothetical protein